MFRTVAGGIAGLPQAALEKLKDLAGEIAEAIDSGEITLLDHLLLIPQTQPEGRGPMAGRRPGPVGCPPGSYYNPVTDRCEVYGPPRVHDRPLMQNVKILMRQWIGSQILKLFAMGL